MGDAVVLQGHGSRDRQVWGPLSEGAAPQVHVLRVRRYLKPPVPEPLPTACMPVTRRGLAWAAFEPVMRSEWTPYLKRRVEPPTALRKLVAGYVPPASGPRAPGS